MKSLDPKPRDFIFSGDVDQRTIGVLTGKLLVVLNHDIELKYKIPGYSPAPLRIYIDSYGGDPYPCLGLISLITASTTPIHTVVTGSAMSAGFMLAVAGHSRFCYPNAAFMTHQMSYDVDGDHESAKAEINENEKMQSRINNLIMSHTKIKKSLITRIMKNKLDFYMTSAEAKRLGVVDVIIKKHDELFEYI